MYDRRRSTPGRLPGPTLESRPRAAVSVPFLGAPAPRSSRSSLAFAGRSGAPGEVGALAQEARRSLCQGSFLPRVPAVRPSPGGQRSGALNAGATRRGQGLWPPRRSPRSPREHGAARAFEAAPGTHRGRPLADAERAPVRPCGPAVVQDPRLPAAACAGQKPLNGSPLVCFPGAAAHSAGASSAEGGGLCGGTIEGPTRADTAPRKAKGRFRGLSSSGAAAPLRLRISAVPLTGGERRWEESSFRPRIDLDVIREAGLAVRASGKIRRHGKVLGRPPAGLAPVRFKSHANAHPGPIDLFPTGCAVHPPDAPVIREVPCDAWVHRDPI